MTDQELNLNWIVLVGCVAALLGFAYMNLWMDVSFEIEKRHAAEEYRP